MNDLGTRTDGDVFGDDAEPRTSFSEAAFEAGFAGELVLEHIQIGHAEGMLAGGFEEGVIPLERGEALGGAFAIESFEELALRVVALELRVRARRKEKEKCGAEQCRGPEKRDGTKGRRGPRKRGGQEKSGISHGGEN